MLAEQTSTFNGFNKKNNKEQELITRDSKIEGDYIYSMRLFLDKKSNHYIIKSNIRLNTINHLPDLIIYKYQKEYDNIMDAFFNYFNNRKYILDFIK